MDELLSWAKSHGACLHPSVEIYNDPATGNSFRVSAADGADGAGVKPGDSVVTCPLDLTLSFLNATTTPSPGFRHQDNDNPPFPPSFLETVPPHVIGRFFLIRQYLLGKASFWYPYIRTLPQPDNLQSWILPPLWPADDIELLEDTNVHVAIAEIKTRLKAEYKHAVAAFGDDPSRGEYTRLLYNWAYCIFTSRSFRPSLVIPATRQHTLSLPEGCGVDDFSLLLPLFDVGNHAPTASIAWESDDATGICALKTSDAYAAGDQVYNNYGTTKTNAELMLAYGFRIPETDALHNDYIHVQKRGAAPPTEGVKGTPTTTKPRDYLVSLRPAADPSSLAVRSLQILSGISVEKILPPFRHVQDAMVWDLILVQTTEEQRREMMPIPEEASEADADLLRLHMVLTGQVPAETTPLLEQTVGIIQNKIFQELERLDQSEFELPEGEEPTGNQLMAYEYRRQCRKVAMNVLESMGMVFEEA